MVAKGGKCRISIFFFLPREAETGQKITRWSADVPALSDNTHLRSLHFSLCRLRTVRDVGTLSARTIAGLTRLAIAM